MVELHRDTFTAANEGRLEALLRAHGLVVRSAAEREALLRDALARVAPGQDVWLFGYGSLMWNPAFRHAEARPARVRGWHRRFCLWNTLGRGTPDRPGLMLALAPGGSCHGMALRIVASEAESELRVVWRREMVSDGYLARWVNAATERGVVPALAFIANPGSLRFAGRLDADTTVRHIARGEGFLGTSRAYLESVVAHLDALGLHDRAMRALRRQVERADAEVGAGGR